MAKKVYDMAVKVGTYQKDGETKNRYQNIGAVLQGDNGPYMIMDRHFNPAGIPNPEDRENLIISLFQPRQNGGGQVGGQQQSQQPQGGGGANFDQDFQDDVPF